MDDGNDNGQVYHVRLNSYERKVIGLMRSHFGTSRVGTIRQCIRAAAQQLGLPPPSVPFTPDE